MTLNRRFFLKGTAGALGLLAFEASITRAAYAQNGGGVLRVAIAKPAGDLDIMSHYAIWAIQDLVFEPLVVYGKNGVIEPGLATEWQLENEGKRLALTLREGVVFQDGTPFDATVAKWNLERWMGAEKFTWMNSSRLFKSVDLIDDFHIAINFREPVLGLLQELSYTRPPRFISPASVKEDGSFGEPIGTGPWKQVSADDTQSVFERFDGYWGPKPSFERLEAKVLPDPRTRVSALRAGELDLLGGAWIAPLAPIDAETLGKDGFSVEVEPSGVTLVMGYNPDRVAALQDINVRKAINIGIDRTAISQALYRGYATPAGDLFASVVPLSGTRHEAPAMDTEGAKALLETAGWTGAPIRMKDGRPLAMEMVVSEDAIPGIRIMAEVMQAQLRDIGIDLSIHTVDHASKHTEMVERAYDLGFFQTYGAPYDPYGTIVGLFLSTFDNDVEGKLVIDPENVDPLVNAATTAVSDDIGPKLQAFYDHLYDNQLIFPIVELPSIWAHPARVKGFSNPSTEYDMPYENITLD